MKVKRFLALTLVIVQLFAMAACGKTETPQSESESQSEPPQEESLQVDVTDLEALAEMYLMPIIYSGATQSTWTDPGVVPAKAFIYMYGYACVWNAEIPESEMETVAGVPYYYVDAATVTEYVQSYFDVAADYLTTAEEYNPERKAYSYDMSGVGFAYGPRVLRGEYDENTMVLVLYLNDGYDGEAEVATLKIQLEKDGSFKYISNEATEEAPPESQPEASQPPASQPAESSVAPESQAPASTASGAKCFICPDVRGAYPYTVTTERLGTKDDIKELESLLAEITPEDILVLAADCREYGYSETRPLDETDVKILLEEFKWLELEAIPEKEYDGVAAWGNGITFYIKTANTQLYIRCAGKITVVYPDKGLMLIFWEYNEEPPDMMEPGKTVTFVAQFRADAYIQGLLSGRISDENRWWYEERRVF